MASPASGAPAATFIKHSKQLQRRLASSSTTTPSTQPFPTGLFKPPNTIIAPWKAIAGAQEWQTSAYHYNKQTLKTLPHALTTTNNLLLQYATMIKSNTPPNLDNPTAGPTQQARTGITSRRRSAERMYVSGANVKDFGDKVVVNAFMFDGIAAAREEKERVMRERREAQAKREAAGEMTGREKRGHVAGPSAGRRRPPPNGGGAGGSGSFGARRMGGGGTRGPAGSGARSGGGGGGGVTFRRVV